MKYVVFKHKTGMLMPVIVPEHVTHSMIKIEDAEPVSAGFFMINKGIVRVSTMDSESLKLGPALEDQELLTNTLNNSGTYAFIHLVDTVKTEM